MDEAIPAALAARVRERANERCEYCGMAQAIQGASFHIEHVVPRSRGGTSGFGNLALACPSCNLCKADAVEVPDRRSGSLCHLFNPRLDSWTGHFKFIGYVLWGKTPVGRATVARLRLNEEPRLTIRKLEALLGLFPPA